MTLAKVGLGKYLIDCISALKIVTIVAIVLSASNIAFAARTLNLEETINLAINHDPDTKYAQRTIEIGKTKRSVAMQGFLPKLDFSITQGPQTDYYGRPIVSQQVFYTGINMEQPLYAGGVITNTKKLAEAETRRQQADYNVRRLAIAAESIKNYYQALTAQATIQRYEALCSQGEEDLRQAQSKLSAGTGTRLECLDLSSKILDYQQKLSKSRTDYQVAVSKLKTITGIQDELNIKLVQELPLQDIRDDVQTLFSEGQTKRPEITYSKEDVTYNNLKTEIEKGKQRPQLSLLARQEWQAPTMFQDKKDYMVMLKASISWENTTLSYNEQHNQTYPNPWAYPSPIIPQQNYVFPVRTLKYSIFDRSTNKPQLEQAQADRDLAYDRSQKLQRQVYYDIKDAYAQKKDSLARMQTAQKQIATAEEFLSITQTRQKVGVTTLSEVFKARAYFAEAQVNLVTAQNDHATALGQLYKALGRNLVLRDKKL